MWKIVFLFLAISIGAVYRINFFGTPQFIYFVELALFFYLTVLFIKSFRKDVELRLTGFDKVFIFLQVFCGLYAVLTYFWSDHGPVVIYGAWTIFVGFFAFVLANIWLKERVSIYQTANRFLLISIVAQLLVNMGLNIDSVATNFYSLKNEAATRLGRSNYISMFIGFVFLYELIARGKRWIWFVALSMLGLFLTMSRGAFLSIGAALVVYAVIVLFNKKTSRIKTGIILIGLLAVVFYFVKNTIIGAELLAMMYFAFETGSTSGRDVLVDKALTQISINPYGNGIVLVDDPHNIILKALRDLGIFIGPIYMVLMMYPIFFLFSFKTFRYSKVTIGLLIGYLSVVIHSLAEIFFFTTTSIVWTVFTLVAINIAIRQERVRFKL